MNKLYYLYLSLCLFMSSMAFTACGDDNDDNTNGGNSDSPITGMVISGAIAATPNDPMFPKESLIIDADMTEHCIFSVKEDGNKLKVEGKKMEELDSIFISFEIDNKSAISTGQAVIQNIKFQRIKNTDVSPFYATKTTAMEIARLPMVNGSKNKWSLTEADGLTVNKFSHKATKIISGNSRIVEYTYEQNPENNISIEVNFK